jgi:hypothetical protein
MTTKMQKAAAIMGITNVLFQQPAGLTEPTIWSQTTDTHGHLNEQEFKTWLADGVTEGALVKQGDRYALSPDFRDEVAFLSAIAA